MRIEINNDGVVILRVPMRTTLKQAGEIIERNRGWIDKHMAVVQAIPTCHRISEWLPEHGL